MTVHIRRRADDGGRGTAARLLLPVRDLLLVVALTFGLSRHAPADAASRRNLLSDEGAAAGGHLIKADPQTGSTRLGVGMQRIKGGHGIPMHAHDDADELLFVHSGTGVGVVGDERRALSPGTTLYVPQGAWHAVEAHGDLEILWVVSPPRFADHLREASETAARTGSVDFEQVGRRYGYGDSRQFFAPRLVAVAAVLGVVAALVTLVSRARPVRAAGVYAIGGVLGTVATLSFAGPGLVPPAVLVVAALMTAGAVLVGSVGGIAVMRLKRLLPRRAPS